MQPFADRHDAGRQLARALSGYRGRNPVVLALPRGGVPVAAEIAVALHAPLDLLLVRKIGHPAQPELAIGAVVDGEHPIIVRNEELIRLAHVSDRAFDELCRAELKEIERRRAVYLGNRSQPGVEGRVVIVVDDGIATGTTVKSALGAIRRLHPKELVLAVPVAPREAIDELRPEVDNLVCLSMPEPFGAVGRFYKSFRQLDDEDVLSILRRVTASEPTADQSARGIQGKPDP